MHLTRPHTCSRSYVAYTTHPRYDALFIYSFIIDNKYAVKKFRLLSLISSVINVLTTSRTSRTTYRTSRRRWRTLRSFSKTWTWIVFGQLYIETWYEPSYRHKAQTNITKQSPLTLFFAGGNKTSSIPIARHRLLHLRVDGIQVQRHLGTSSVSAHAQSGTSHKEQRKLTSFGKSTRYCVFLFSAREGSISAYCFANYRKVFSMFEHGVNVSKNY